MTRIHDTFTRLKRPALITFIMGGDPDAKRSVSILKSLPEAGADLIEIGMAFTDPVADGPSIQMAGSRALNAGVNIDQIFEMVKEFRGSNDTVPVILMGYANPVFTYGTDRFIAGAKKAGVDGVILVDLPPEESHEISELTQKAGLDFIRLITPTTDADRLTTILDGASGFLYYVSITGVTGGAKPDPAKIKNHLEMVRAKTDLPVAVGFGIRTPEDAAAFKGIADGVVVGSALVNTVAEYVESPDLTQKIAAQVQALVASLKD